ncbi:unnamed protein product [Lathyrus sativus]|nr:unnamed protein product [Lathyrus sativus]
MPSGAKKRKAAKKKKEIKSSTSSNNPQGENELKSIDEKGSDGGEGDSPRNHDEDHNQFNEGSDEVEEIEPLAAGVKSEEEVQKDSKVDEGEGGKESVDVIEWDMKSDESSENKDVSVVRIKSDEGLNNGSRNSGGSNEVIETGTGKNAKDESYDNSVKETAAFDKEPVSLVKGSVNSAAESSAGSVNGVNSVSEMQSGDAGNNLLEKSLGSQGAETDLAVKRNEDKVRVLPDENVKTLSLEEPEPREFDGKVSSSPASQGAETDLAVKRNEDKVHVLPDENVKTLSLEEPEPREFDGKVSSSPASQGAETDLAVKRIEDKAHVLPDENVKTSSLGEHETREFEDKVSSSPVSQGVETDLTVKRNEDKVHILPDENVKTLIIEESETREFDGKVSSSPVSQGPITESTNGVERVKDSNTAECSENQSPVASAPHIVQKTSWLSCCGLFEALSRSNR